MKRIVKNPEVRRQEIIEAALQLFESEGYNKTSVEAVIKKAGIAKGTFYYYFKSKQDILKATVENIVSEIESYFLDIVDNKKMSAVKKLEAMIVGAKKQQTIKPHIMKIVDLPENREMQELLNIQGIKVIAPLITTVCIQGYESGHFKKKASLESIQIILASSQILLESGLFDWSSPKREHILIELKNIFEYVLGAKSGALNFLTKA